jgi:transcriptional regulator with XRE-family HTH domain
VPQNVSKNVCGPRVKEGRRIASPKLTQDQLSARLATKGITLDRSAVAKIECGLRHVADMELRYIAQVLNVNVGWLLGYESRSKFKSTSPEAKR